MALRSCVRDAASACDAVKLGRVATGRELLISTEVADADGLPTATKLLAAPPVSANSAYSAHTTMTMYELNEDLERQVDEAAIRNEVSSLERRRT